MAAAIGGVFRGHLVFTARMNAEALGAERTRARTVTLAVDGFIAAALVTDAFILAPTRPLASVLTLALAIGLALARTLLEPATTRAAFPNHEEQR